MFSLDVIFLISGLFLAAFGVYLFFSTLLRSNEDQQALALASSDDDDSAHKMPPFMQFSKRLTHNLTIQHAKKIKTPKYRDKVNQKLIYAGFTKNLNVDEFMGLQILWGILFPCFFIVLNFALQMGYPVWVFVGMGAFGAYFPHIYCKTSISQRQKSVERELPFFIDLLALSTEAGLDFIGAIQKITEKASQDSVLSNEFLITLKDIKLGASRSDALLGLEKRVKSLPLKSFVTMIQDADETGASVAKVLKAKAEQMRYERFNKAEEEGAKTSQKILFPMIIFIVPAILITIFAPIALQFYYGGGGS